MENYIKTVLYAYPLLKNVGEDYAEHIRNCALLSYRSPKTALEQAEYIAEEILKKESLVWLKNVVEENLDKLSALDRELIAIRYFGKKRKVKPSPFRKSTNVEGVNPQTWSERKYFRYQQQLSNKIAAMLLSSGLTKKFFDKELAEIEMIKKIHRFVEAGRDRKVAADERRWLSTDRTRLARR